MTPIARIYARGNSIIREIRKIRGPVRPILRELRDSA